MTAPTPVVTYASLVGNALVLRRKELGFSQAYVSKLLNWSPSILSRLENGESSLSIEQLANICERLSMRPSELLIYVDNKVIELKEKGISVIYEKASPEEIFRAGAYALSGSNLVPLMGVAGFAIAGSALGLACLLRSSADKSR